MNFLKQKLLILCKSYNENYVFSLGIYSKNILHNFIKL